MLKKIISIIFIFLLFNINIINASEVNVTSEKYILYNLNDNTILDEKNSTDKTYIASLTKIMTVIVAIEHIDDFNKEITITNEMLKDIEWDVAVTGFKVGEKVTYNDLLYGAILSSGADAVNALAISVSGDKEKFVKLMNDKVKELKLDNTNFANVVGLYDENNYSSALDVSKILMYALKNNKFKEVFETKEYVLSNGKKINSTIYNYSKNSDLNLDYITGAKTGYISKSGYCLASTATIDGVNYLLVTLNAFSSVRNTHIKDSIKIYDYFNSNYGYKDIVNNDDIVVCLDTIHAKEDRVCIKSGVNINKYITKKFYKNDLQYEYSGVSKIDIDTEKGSKIGKIKVLYNNEELDEFDLVFNETLTISLMGILNKSMKYIIIFLIVILVFKILIPSKKQ